MTTFKQFHELHIQLTSSYGVKIAAKDKKLKYLWLAIHWFLKIISFGKMSTFYTAYTTTIGNRIYYPAGWHMAKATKQDYVILRHEAEHVRQIDKLGDGSMLWGTLIMGFLYLFIPLPIFFAWFRYKFEREAYRESIRTIKSLGDNPDLDWYVQQLTGPSYLWTWVLKKRVRRWFEEHC